MEESREVETRCRGGKCCSVGKSCRGGKSCKVVLSPPLHSTKRQNAVAMARKGAGKRLVIKVLELNTPVVPRY